jgi:hypothetical protein
MSEVMKWELTNWLGISFTFTLSNTSTEVKLTAKNLDEAKAKLLFTVGGQWKQIEINTEGWEE